jgi:hypothetical protein
MCLLPYPDECDDVCPGNAKQPCGGTLRISEFSYACGDAARFSCKGWFGLHLIIDLYLFRSPNADEWAELKLSRRLFPSLSCVR